MIRKATAKRSEANAAVRRRAAGLDQRFKMSASVAGFPSINAATACLPEFFVAPSARASTQPVYSVLQLLQITRRCSSSTASGDYAGELYASAGFCSDAVARLGCLH